MINIIYKYFYYFLLIKKIKIKFNYFYKEINLFIHCFLIDDDDDLV